MVWLHVFLYWLMLLYQRMFTSFRFETTRVYQVTCEHRCLKLASALVRTMPCNCPAQSRAYQCWIQASGSLAVNLSPGMHQDTSANYLFFSKFPFLYLQTRDTDVPVTRLGKISVKLDKILEVKCSGWMMCAHSHPHAKYMPVPISRVCECSLIWEKKKKGLWL